MCRIDDCDTQVYSSKHVTARKSHVCDECHRSISPGERYLYAFFVSEGGGVSCHTCAHCLAAAEWLVKNCGGWVHAQVLEELVEHQGDYPNIREALQPLVDGIAAKWSAPDGAPVPLPALPAPLDVHA